MHILQQNLQNIQNKVGINALNICNYIWWYFYQLRTQEELKIKCVYESKKSHSVVKHAQTRTVSQKNGAH